MSNKRPSSTTDTRAAKKPRTEPAYRVIPFDPERTWWQYIYAPTSDSIESQVILFDPNSVTAERREDADERICGGEPEDVEFFVKLVADDEFLAFQEDHGARIPLIGDWCNLKEAGPQTKPAKIEQIFLYDQDGMWKTIMSK